MNPPLPSEPVPVESSSTAVPDLSRFEPGLSRLDPDLSRLQPAPRPSSARVWWGAGLLLVGLAGLAVRAMLLHHNLDYWRYVWLTLPVAAAGAYLAYRLAQGRGFGVSHLSGLVVGTLGTSYLTGLTGGSAISSSLFGGMNVQCMLQQAANCATPAPATESPLQAGQRILTNYWDLYGPTGIVSAVLVGAVVGVGFGLLINRNVRRP
jgi:hypothetical protein